MIRTFLFMLFFGVTCLQAQVSKVVNSNLYFMGKEPYNIVFTDSISKILGTSSIRIMKPLFFSDENSYVLVKIRRVDLKKEESLVLRINNNFIDFKKSVGFKVKTILTPASMNMLVAEYKGFGKSFIDEVSLKNSLYEYGQRSQNAIMFSTITSLATTGILTSYSAFGGKDKKAIVLIGLVGSGMTIGGVISWIDSYKYVKFYSIYKEAINIEDLKLK